MQKEEGQRATVLGIEIVFEKENFKRADVLNTKNENEKGI